MDVDSMRDYLVDRHMDKLHEEWVCDLVKYLLEQHFQDMDEDEVKDQYNLIDDGVA